MASNRGESLSHYGRRNGHPVGGDTYDPSPREVEFSRGDYANETKSLGSGRRTTADVTWPGASLLLSSQHRLVVIFFFLDQPVPVVMVQPTAGVKSG